MSTALAATGFDAREVPAQRMAAQLRAHRLDYRGNRHITQGYEDKTAKDYLTRKEGRKARPAGKPDAPTNATLPTA